MTSPIPAPDQTEHARASIEHMLALDPEARDGTLARLIAACIHQGPSSALHRFAAEGIVTPRLHLELDLLDHYSDEMTLPQYLELEGWIDALKRYLLVEGIAS